MCPSGPATTVGPRLAGWTDALAPAGSRVGPQVRHVTMSSELTSRGNPQRPAASLAESSTVSGSYTSTARSGAAGVVSAAPVAAVEAVEAMVVVGSVVAEPVAPGPSG